LPCLLAMDAGYVIQLPGLLLDGGQVGVIDLHDGARIKSAYLAMNYFDGKIRPTEFAL